MTIESARIISMDTASVTAVGSWNEPGIESFVPDRQTVAIPVENLNAVTTAINEGNKRPEGRILAEGGGHQAGKGRRSLYGDRWPEVEEHADRMMEADHLGLRKRCLAAAIARTRRQAKRGLSVAIRRWIPLGRSASIGS